MILSIIIINYNSKSVLRDCLCSLSKSSLTFSHEVIVIDNGSLESINDLEKEFCSFKFLYNKINIGFAAANNNGIRMAQGKYILLLNPDTIVKKDSISILLEEMDKNSDASLGTGQIRYYPEYHKIWYGGGKMIGWRGLAVHLMENRNAEELSEDSDSRYVDFISGCYLCIRSASLKNLGFLNEKFFLYLEDIEYCARAVKNNLKLLYVPRSIIYHNCNGERKLKEQTLYYAVRNRKLLIDLVFKSRAKVYFNLVIRYKLILWFIKDKRLYKAARKGLQDYRNNVFGPIDLSIFD